MTEKPPNDRRMNPDAVREFIKLMRAYLHLQADMRYLAAMLKTCEDFNQVPYGWLDALKQARTTPEYRSISEQVEPLLAALEESLAESELARLIESIPTADWIN